MSEIFEHNGFKFLLEIEYDDGLGAPWEEYDGNGIVSQWTSRDKRPHERILCQYHDSKRLYDVQATMARAKKDGWGLSQEDRQALAARLGREPTKGEVLAEAVDRDFEYLKRWCDNEWYYASLHVTMVDHPEHDTYLGGVEYDPWNDYHMDCAHEMADELIYEWQKTNAWRLRQDLCTTHGALA